MPIGNHLFMRACGATLVLLLCCAHASPRWDPAARRLCGESGCYRVGPLSPPWRLLRVTETEVAFFHDQLSAVMQSNRSCREEGESAPLGNLTAQLLIGYTDRRIRSEERVALAEREALHTILDARLDGVPMVLDLYVFKRNGCIFDLSYAALPERYVQGVADFERFVRGFVDERRS